MTHFILDCDDVLLDWQSGFVAYLSTRGVVVDPAGPKTWDLSPWIGCTPDAARSWVERFNASDQFGRLAARPGAVEFVAGLRAVGHTASVLTCCGDLRKTAQARVSNLDLVFGGPDVFDFIDVLRLGEAKLERLEAIRRMLPPEDLVFVEDNFMHAQTGAVCGIVSYCLRRSHNRRLEELNYGTKVIWVDDLHEILPHMAEVEA